MAHLNYHGKIVRTWKNKHSEVRYHLTETSWLLRTSGPRLGNCKVIAKPLEEEKREQTIHQLSNSANWESKLVY